jgi:integrase
MWRKRNFCHDLLAPCPRSLRPRHPPHECRHIYVTHLRAAGVKNADLAEIAGHRVETMLARYTHAVGQSFPVVRATIG